jgi:hypothetical protein
LIVKVDLSRLKPETLRPGVRTSISHGITYTNHFLTIALDAALETSLTEDRWSDVTQRTVKKFVPFTGDAIYMNPRRALGVADRMLSDEANKFAVAQIVKVMTELAAACQ